MTRRAKALAAAAPVALVAWTALASALFVLTGGLTADFPLSRVSSYWTWWRYALASGDTIILSRPFLIVSAALAAFPIALIAFIVLRRVFTAPKPELYGRTDWVDDAEVDANFRRSRNPLS